jgi:predicted nucleic-acid-binding protein
MICLDTSSLIRFFTNDDLAKAKKVKELLEKEKDIRIPEVVFPELEYVLKGVYQTPRKRILGVFQFLISRSNCRLSPSIPPAIKLFENTNLDIADCLIVSHSIKGKLASFDNQMLAVKDVKKYW